MAPADSLSPPGSASYSSDTTVVGDGTWDFTKNTFLLPNLVGLNFETMRYNGMGNRFSTLTQYHSIVLAHGVLGAITFLFLIPFGVMTVRFYRKRPGYAVRYHAYLNILAVGLSTVVFVLGWFAVGPKRSLTNPHHGIGVAIYTLILLQAIGGRLIKHIRGRSLRVMIHQWSGRTIALLGIVQVPLGLTLYGSPKYTFVLYALWMAFLLLLYFILSYRHFDRPDDDIRGGRSEGGRTDRRSSGGALRWLGPLAAGAGAFALLRGRNRDRPRSRSRSRSRSVSRSRVSRPLSRSRSRPPEVLSSRRGSESYVEDEKHRDRPRKSGGFMDKVLGVGAALGAGALLSSFLEKRNKRRRDDEEYSAVATDTPSRRQPSRHRRPAPSMSEFTADSEEYSRRDGRRTPLLPGPGGPPMAAAMSAAESRPGTSRPMTPRPSHRRGDSRLDSVDESDYSSYVSPSRRGRDERGGATRSAGKGLLAGLGLGWFAKKMQDRRGRRDDEGFKEEEEERRAGGRGSRYTGDGYSTPSRRQRRPSMRRPPGPATTITSTTLSEESSSAIEPRPVGSGYGPPMPPLPAGGAAPPTIVPVPAGTTSRSASRSRHDPATGPAAMPPMPGDPGGLFARDSDSEAYASPSDRPRRRGSSRRRRAGEQAAAAAAASASVLAAEEQARRRDGSTQPVSVKVKMHDDRDRNVTLRRLTEDETAAARRQRRRGDSTSTLSGPETPANRRYRRDSSTRRAEEAAELAAEPLPPPAPAFAGGRRPKDSAYYSGQPGPSGSAPAAGATVSSLNSLASPGSHGTWSQMSPSPSQPRADRTESADERRRRRRLERRDARPAGTVDFS